MKSANVHPLALKYIVLTIKEKCEILEILENGEAAYDSSDF